MRFRFLHAADLHLGSPMLGLALKDREIARRFAEASREAFTELVERSLEAGVAFVVIAGDLYDGEWKDSATGLFFNREAARLTRAGIPLYILKGNHDAESQVTRTLALPDLARTFSARRPETFRLPDLKVALHGQSFRDRAVTENLAAGYPPPVPGWFNIGVLHTALAGRPPHAPYAPCAPEELRAKGYDYWALGHVHAYEVVAEAPWIVFPGNLQGRSVRECGPRGAVLVEVEDGRVAAVERLIVDRARWCDLALDLAGVESEGELLSRAEAALGTEATAAEGRLLALRLRLLGATPLHASLAAETQRWRDELQAAAQRCHEDIWLERLLLQTTAPAAAAGGEAAGLELQGLLQGLAEDPALRAEALALLQQIQQRLPLPEEQPLTERLDELLGEAGRLLLARGG